ncbi:hypothetical protein [Alcaligenes faecalis]|uniref:hypothetical protein n=1 Tax=Alcaligenes faecalis TaxID=511 RepID=UPI00122CDFD3|nr:hypothetical protein [Alcaligenes faecalis]
MKRSVVVLSVFMFAGLLTACGDGKDSASKKASEARMTEIKLQRLVRGFVTAKLKDPDSAQFRNQKGICGEVNAKNSFGGMTGYTRFMASNENFVVMENDPALERGAFAEVWEQFCK